MVEGTPGASLSAVEDVSVSKTGPTAKEGSAQWGGSRCEPGYKISEGRARIGPVSVTDVHMRFGGKGVGFGLGRRLGGFPNMQCRP